ncbi:MAG TPA: hypothetical protein VIO64_17270 [Pseudobacteroides sp.]
MSIETYEKLVEKFELYKLLHEGLDSMRSKNARSFHAALSDIRKA